MYHSLTNCLFFFFFTEDCDYFPLWTLFFIRVALFIFYIQSVWIFFNLTAADEIGDLHIER